MTLVGWCLCAGDLVCRLRDVIAHSRDGSQATRQRRDGASLHCTDPPAELVSPTGSCPALASSTATERPANLDAYVWPKGPAGVGFSASESAELYGHLRAFYFQKDWDYKVDPAKGFVRVEWEQFRSWISRDQPRFRMLYVHVCAVGARTRQEGASGAWQAGVHAAGAEPERLTCGCFWESWWARLMPTYLRCASARRRPTRPMQH